MLKNTQQTFVLIFSLERSSLLYHNLRNVYVENISYVKTSFFFMWIMCNFFFFQIFQSKFIYYLSIAGSKNFVWESFCYIYCVKSCTNNKRINLWFFRSHVSIKSHLFEMKINLRVQSGTWTKIYKRHSSILFVNFYFLWILRSC